MNPILCHCRCKVRFLSFVSGMKMMQDLNTVRNFFNELFEFEFKFKGKEINFLNFYIPLKRHESLSAIIGHDETERTIICA